MADTDSGSEFEVGQILGERKTGKRGLEFLVRWKGFGKSEDSWEKSTALKDAKVAIQEFRQATTKKTKRKSSSRSRSRSRTRSKSRSPARSKKESSPARRSSRSRKSLTTTTTNVSQSPGKTEEKKETITQAPGLYEQKTETITKSSEPQRTATYSRTVETVVKTGPSKTIEPEQESLFQRWVSCCCAPVQKIGNCCRGLVTSDYPALVVFATISIIMLSFVLEKHVDFERFWQGILGFFASLWAWLSGLVSSKTG